jgi:hypothetical protein
MFANAASVLTQVSGSHLEVWRFTGKQFVHRAQRHVSIYYHRFGCFNQVGLSVTLSGILAAAAKIHRGPPSPQLHLSCVSRPCHMVQKPNCKFNVDANSGHAFGILLAAVGTLRPCGAPAPVN